MGSPAWWTGPLALPSTTPTPRKSDLGLSETGTTYGGPSQFARVRAQLGLPQRPEVVPFFRSDGGWSTVVFTEVGA